VGGVEISAPQMLLRLRWEGAASAAAALPVTEAAVGGDEESFPRVLSFLLVGVHCLLLEQFVVDVGSAKGSILVHLWWRHPLD